MRDLATCPDVGMRGDSGIRQRETTKALGILVLEWRTALGSSVKLFSKENGGRREPKATIITPI